MKLFSNITIFSCLIILSNNLNAQNIADSAKNTEINQNDTLKTLPYKNKLLNNQIINSPEQILFNQSYIDSFIDKQNNSNFEKQGIIDSAYRAVKLYALLHKKNFEVWESEYYKNLPKLDVSIYNNSFEKPIGSVGGIIALLRLFFGKDFGRDPYQMPAEKRYLFEKEWKRNKTYAKSKNLVKQLTKNKALNIEQSLKDSVNEFVETKKHVHF